MHPGLLNWQQIKIWRQGHRLGDGASGYAAVWATENTRWPLWDAMPCRETYAITGLRTIVRLFGGWGFELKHAHNWLPAHIGYSKGVPMGGGLTSASGNKGPTLPVSAVKAPI